MLPCLFLFGMMSHHPTTFSLSNARNCGRLISRFCLARSSTWARGGAANRGRNFRSCATLLRTSRNASASFNLMGETEIAIMKYPMLATVARRNASYVGSPPSIALRRMRANGQWLVARAWARRVTLPRHCHSYCAARRFTARQSCSTAPRRLLRDAYI